MVKSLIPGNMSLLSSGASLRLHNIYHSGGCVRCPNNHPIHNTPLTFLFRIILIMPSLFSDTIYTAVFSISYLYSTSASSSIPTSSSTKLPPPQQTNTLITIPSDSDPLTQNASPLHPIPHTPPHPHHHRPSRPSRLRRQRAHHLNLNHDLGLNHSHHTYNKNRYNLRGVWSVWRLWELWEVWKLREL
jgi:hypothetical protein